MLYQRSSALFQEAKNYIPGGVNSPVRAFKSVGGTPVFMKSAKGAYLTDADDKTYIDYINSWGPAILGHTHPEVLEAVKLQAEKGFSFGTPTELETEIAKFITENVPNIDQIRMVSSGTEACMSAIRLARGYTGRDKIIKFEGCYHGHSDSFLIKAGSGAATFGNPNSPGVTQGTAKDTLLARYNDWEQIQDLFRHNEGQIAAVIIEPVAGNMGCVLPENNFLQNLRQICDRNGTLLIFDEVMTGFRLGFGGAQEVYGVKADLVTYGKVIGGGMPVGAFAGRREIMECLAPKGAVYQAGTLSGNPIAMRAGLTTLQLIKNDENFYQNLDKTTEKLDFEIAKILNEKGIEYRINRKGSMMSVFFHTNRVANFDEAQQANHSLFNTFFHHLLERGVYLPPSGYETWFISSEIKDNEIDKTLEAIRSFQY
ncbi:glutamate-1-semialdehyde 2,1-aminomutase [Riemerella anatipestifer]|uniref:Glutamate-1-semialdehyde 2,1-aminomutase n=1 Tax=Riemerella anatipestifer (strain ATCC 11845 / DSM 15868 / JCM 9532 / NCTC 11014) TaxID=693978 RepID=E4TDL4_RIEAD|nr:glutamate-1-semialdehyde 2,1-aminomutase [Riemerella anatipestifer]ADQ82873.1 glutamate-1-semialdehyde-2,1-aminomutase [Riemerella anatipestifer ATCC 11845 = DSM 15868]ADZ11633.1 Glutamate-1-semialdehyde aminotransferase [Riemerella anatipestifer RA-GD]AFD56885.1 glutamategene-semialdehydegene,1-aminomutase [Riemerella anatipestifer ATCC 11845 = DSM 15868]AGC41172.1 Glutamate-1-semialdehyde aminotransferase [Riemerella anatipestifer RA-CH-2]AKP70040.1 glutamate-1-semialdehyde-2,1-aminomutas